MKKILFAAALIACLSVAACAAFHLATCFRAELEARYSAGFDAGQAYFLENVTVFTVDCYNPADPEASAWNGYDQKIFFELDGQIYEKGMYQG